MFSSRKNSMIILGTLMLIVMIICRIIVTQRSTYFFLTWNLFLAILPLAIAAISKRYDFKEWKLLLATISWFIFFPNAPYIITDLKHLTNLHGAPYWYDTLMLFTAAATGTAMAFYSLQIMEEQWRAAWGSYWPHKSGRTHQIIFRLLGIAFIFLCTGFGIYLGRVLRYNSWDVVTDPHGLVLDISERVFNPIEYRSTWTFTFFYGAALFIFYQAWCGWAGIRQKVKQD